MHEISTNQHKVVAIQNRHSQSHTIIILTWKDKMQGPTKYTNKIHLVILVLALLPLGSLAFSNFFAMKRVTSAELDKHDSIVLQPIPSASICALESEDRGA